jgi:hypothetical protein
MYGRGINQEEGILKLLCPSVRPSLFLSTRIKQQIATERFFMKPDSADLY